MFWNPAVRIPKSPMDWTRASAKGGQAETQKHGHRPGGMLDDKPCLCDTKVFSDAGCRASDERSVRVMTASLHILCALSAVGPSTPPTQNPARIPRTPAIGDAAPPYAGRSRTSRPTADGGHLVPVCVSQRIAALLLLPLLHAGRRPPTRAAAQSPCSPVAVNSNNIGPRGCGVASPTDWSPMSDWTQPARTGTASIIKAPQPLSRADHVGFRVSCTTALLITNHRHLREILRLVLSLRFRDFKDPTRLSSRVRKPPGGNIADMSDKESRSDPESCATDAHLYNSTIEHLTWRGVTVTVKDRENKQPRNIVDDAFGIVRAGASIPPQSADLASIILVDIALLGEMCALMGPSGCGKTTLLNVLAGRPTNASKVESDILVNGKHVSKSDFRQISCFVEQEDALIGSLTVRETLDFSSRLSSGR